jgi:hypothetical protein
MNQQINRRHFLSTTAIAGTGVALSLSQIARANPGSKMVPLARCQPIL